jgi:tRNA(His) guanylyltransferase
MRDVLGSRIKRYEAVSNYHLTPRSPAFLRVDGKSFHTYTRNMDRPFDRRLIGAMVAATQATAKEMMGFKLAYTQSDEATFLLTDYDTFEAQGWFDYELQKVISVTASAFTAHFNRAIDADLGPDHGLPVALFDTRAFVVPESDMANVFLWRQQDWARNSLQMLARAHYTHTELDKRKRADLHELLFAKGVNWATLDDQLKNGTYVTRDGATWSDVLPVYAAIEALLLEQLQAREEDTP